MAIYRVYSGDDGQSHVEEMKLEDHPELTAGQNTANITFRTFPADREDEFHTAPRRQYIITLSGEVEVEVGDGSTVRYQPGDARLVEDLTGQGHITRVIGGQPSVNVIIPLAGQ